jgi:Prokaryotic cytochrome b561
MKSSISPYQPVLLRLLHSAIALLAFAALITGFIIYDRYDKRFGALNLSFIRNPQDIHSKIASIFVLALAVFALYCFHIGYRRLVQAKSLTHLQEIGKPIWWISLQRLTNTMLLLSATFAVATGRMMQSEWLPNSELNSKWYIGHLISWVFMVIGIAIHLLMSAKVGGLPLLLSIYNWKISNEDMPNTWLRGFKIIPSTKLLFIFEFLVIIGIVFAFIIRKFVHHH